MKYAKTIAAGLVATFSTGCGQDEIYQPAKGDLADQYAIDQWNRESDASGMYLLKMPSSENYQALYIQDHPRFMNEVHNIYFITPVDAELISPEVKEKMKVLESHDPEGLTVRKSKDAYSTSAKSGINCIKTDFSVKLCYEISPSPNTLKLSTNGSVNKIDAHDISVYAEDHNEELGISYETFTPASPQ